jgi:hypothetical protein
MVATPSQIPGAGRSASLGVTTTSSHSESVAGAIGTLFTVAGDRHLAFEDEKPGTANFYSVRAVIFQWA